jgi:hypothetical protein
LGLLISATAFAVTPVAKAGNVLDNGLSLNGISMNGIALNGVASNGIALNGLPSDGLVTGVTSGELNGVAVQAVILPASTR